MSWGAGRWGEDVWAESGAGITHSLQARGGVSTTADAERLGAKHILEARLRIKTESFQIGQGPAPIHPMIAAPAAITTTTFGSSLTRLHNMAAIAAIATSGEPARLKVGHHMTAVAVVSTGNTGRLRQKHPMAASAAINSGAAAVRLIHSHLLEGRAVVRTATAGRYTIAIPDILPPDALAPDAPDVVVPGIVNLARNPDGRGELEGWHGLNFAVVDPDPARPWNGEQSIHVVAPGAVANEGVIGDSHYPLGLAPVGGSIVWGQAMIASETLVQLHAWVRVYFTDGSYDTGLASEPTYAGGLGFGGDWSLIQAPPVSLTAGRVVDFIELYLTNASLPTLTPVEWWVGGAQIEYDRWQYGPTPVLTEEPPAADVVN